MAALTPTTWTRSRVYTACSRRSVPDPGAPQIDMRDDYEPKLLPRVSSGKKDEFKEVCPPQTAQPCVPQVKAIRLSPGENGSVTAEVDVEGG